MDVSGTMDPAWNNDVLNPAFHSLTADDFEVTSHLRPSSCRFPGVSFDARVEAEVDRPAAHLQSR